MKCPKIGDFVRVRTNGANESKEEHVCLSRWVGDKYNVIRHGLEVIEYH